VDWLQKNLLAAAVSISPTHRSSSSLNYKKNVKGKSNSTPLVDVDQQVASFLKLFFDQKINKFKQYM